MARKRPLTSEAERYFATHYGYLKLMREMWQDPRVLMYNDPQIPAGYRTDGLVMLLGPTSRNLIPQYNWRSRARGYLRKHGYMGWIAVPEPRGLALPGDFTNSSFCHLWESDRLFTCTEALIWIPRDSSELLGMNTNLETGLKIGEAARDRSTCRLHIGWPKDAPRVDLIEHYAHLAGVTPVHELEALCEQVAHAHKHRR